jgi:hypothetical protein
MQHIGIDVHKNASQLCFVDKNGEITEKRIKTERDRFQDALAKAPRSKVLIEASTESEWVARCIEQQVGIVLSISGRFACVVDRTTPFYDTSELLLRDTCIPILRATGFPIRAWGFSFLPHGAFRGVEPTLFLFTPDRSKLFGSHGQRPWFYSGISRNDIGSL